MTTAEVKPWEPVMGGYSDFGIWDWMDSDWSIIPHLDGKRLHVTLANGQRIMVRAKK